MNNGLTPAQIKATDHRARIRIRPRASSRSDHRVSLQAGHAARALLGLQTISSESHRHLPLGDGRLTYRDSPVPSVRSPEHRRALIPPLAVNQVTHGWQTLHLRLLCGGRASPRSRPSASIASSRTPRRRAGSRPVRWSWRRRASPRAAAIDRDVALGSRVARRDRSGRRVLHRPTR